MSILLELPPYYYPENQAEYQYIYEYLESLLFSCKYQKNPLFTLEIISKVSHKYWQNDFNLIKNRVRNIFHNYIAGNLFDANYFLFLANAVKKINDDDNSMEIYPDENFLEFLKSYLLEDNLVFKSFLKMTIYDLTTESKSLWTRLYKQYDDLLFDYKVSPIFKELNEFNDFIKSFDNYKSEDFYQEYCEFLDKLLESQSNSINFNFKHLQSHA